MGDFSKDLKVVHKSSGILGIIDHKLQKGEEGFDPNTDSYLIKVRLGTAIWPASSIQKL